VFLRIEENRYSYMKNTFLISIVYLFSLLTASCEKEKHGENIENKAALDLKICSFNIRFDNPDDGFNQWENRRKHVVNFLGVEMPDIIGLQEVLVNQLEYIEKRLTMYSSIGVGREDGNTAGEFAPVLFKKERFEISGSGTFWLSETPEEPSLGWDALIKRICTYAYLTDKRTGEEIHVYNTHFSHVSELARLRSAELIMARINEYSYNARVILTGDFNTEPGSKPYTTIIENGLHDSYQSDLRLGPRGTYNGFRLTGAHDRRIDYIFMKGFHSKYYIANSLVIDNQYLSDHFPVITLLEYKNGTTNK
jgi:endonuclease/exonuclease/phosphatase family metal-dependent hydrolase